MKTTSGSAAARYDRALRYGRHRHLPPDYPRPQPTSAWPKENVALLERYRDWLLGGGSSQYAVNMLYIPMAGHVLGLNLKPHQQIDFDADLERALDYVRAKQLSAEWTGMCRNALDRFRRFLRQQRGSLELTLQVRPLNREHYCARLPDWLIEQLERYQHLVQRNWRPARLSEHAMRFWNAHTRLWRWLFAQYPISSLLDVRRQHVFEYIDHRLAGGAAASTVNQELRAFQALLRYLQSQDVQVPVALLRIPGLKQPDRLPRFLTDEQVRLLRDDLEGRVAQASSPAQQRDALLDRAAFYLLWQGGLRVSELEELRLEDLDLPGRKLVVRRGKGQQDRTVYLTATAIRALQDYLDVRGMGPTDHVFLYRNRALRKDLVRERIKAAGRRAGVKASPHRLRHTCATQLLNAGCRVTSIQRLLGHRRLNSTMVYARVHDRTVAEDYYAAMARIEENLDISASAGQPPDTGEPANVSERDQLLALLDRLAAPQVSVETRLDLVEQVRRMVAPP
jgi:site-specific recombinase XerD